MTVTEVIGQIVALGEENEWFIEFLPHSDAYTYITSIGNVIYIDTSCIEAFKDPDKVLSDDELEDQFREMIEVNVPESNNFQIMVQIKDDNNYLL